MPKKKTQRSPSLNAVRAFEAVARLLSYARAATELNVTPSAVSHQIAALEEFFGVPLVRVVHRQLSLTPAGEKYFRQVSQGLTQLTLASTSLLEAKDARVLRITMAPTIANWWFVPRLERFTSQFPDISIDVSATMAVTDFGRGQYDVAIRYSKRIHTGLHAIPLGKNEAFPVCSPHLQKGPRPLRKAKDLQAHTLISTRDDLLVDEPIGNWPGWLKSTNNDGISGVRHLHLSPRALMLQAVTQGVGVGIARTLLAAEPMRAHQLVCPFGPALTLAGNYYIICPEITARDPDIASFRDWIIAEAEESAASVRIPKY